MKIKYKVTKVSNGFIIKSGAYSAVSKDCDGVSNEVLMGLEPVLGMLNSGDTRYITVSVDDKEEHIEESEIIK